MSVGASRTGVRTGVGAGLQESQGTALTSRGRADGEAEKPAQSRGSARQILKSRGVSQAWSEASAPAHRDPEEFIP